MRSGLVAETSAVRSLDKRQISAEVHHEQVRGVGELLDVVRIGELGDRHVAAEPQFFDELREHLSEDRVDPDVANRRERRDDERVGDERQDVTGVVRSPEACLDGVGRRARTARDRERGEQRVDERGADLPLERHLLERGVGEAPRRTLRSERGALDGVEEPVEVVRDPLRAVVDGWNAGVVAVVAGDAAFERLDRPAVKAACGGSGSSRRASPAASPRRTRRSARKSSRSTSWKSPGASKRIHSSLSVGSSRCRAGPRRSTSASARSGSARGSRSQTHSGSSKRGSP